jgi:hypothetical protein
MNPTYYRPLNVDICPIQWSGEETEHLYSVRLQYRPDGAWQTIETVHIPASLNKHFAEGYVAGFHLETLDLQGIANKLPGCPRFAVLGLHSRDGQHHVEMPRAFQASRASRAVASMLVAALAAVTYTASPFGAGALLSAALWLAWSAHRVVPVPFKVVREIG